MDVGCQKTPGVHVHDVEPRGVTFDDYVFDEGARNALRERLAGFFGTIAQLGEVIAAIVDCIGQGAIPEGAGLERLVTRERCLAAEARTDAAHLAAIALATIDARGEGAHVRMGCQRLLQDQLGRIAAHRPSKFAQISMVKDARDLRRLAEAGKVAEHLAFGCAVRALDTFGIDVDEDEDAARALMVADAFRYAPQRDAEGWAAGSGLPYLTGTVEGAAAALRCADGVAVDGSAFRLADEPYLFALAPLDDCPAVMLVPKTRFWQALRDLIEVDADLSDEIAQLLSAAPLLCDGGTALVPAAMLEAAGIPEDTRSFTLVGAGDRLELWPTDAWKRACRGFNMEELLTP